MSEFTVSLDESVTESLEQMAREKAVPLSTLVAESLMDLVTRHKARKRFRDLVEKSPIPLDENWRWNREELYDRAVFRRHERDPVRDDGTEQ